MATRREITATGFARKLRTTVASLVLAFVVVGLFAFAAKADVSFTVSPSMLEFAVDPGVRFEQVITVTNEGSDPAHLYIGVSAVSEGRPDISAAGWFRVNPEEFDLEPGKGKEVTVTVSVPGDVQPGGRYAVVYFRTSPTAVDAVSAGKFGGGTGVGAQIGAGFLLTVRGTGLRLEGQLTRVVPVAAGPGRIGFRVEVTNTGNVHMVPTGQIELKDQQGNVVGLYTLSETTPILPGTTKSFYFEGVQSVPDGDYQASGTIDYGWTEQQVQAAKVDPEAWTQQEAAKDIAFNSVPKLRVVQLQMGGSSDTGVQVTLALENYGDVEVSPAGIIDVLNKAGERALLLDIPAGSWTIEPHQKSTRQYVYTGPLQRGEYTVNASLNYHGQETAVEQADTIIERDITPPVAPEAPEARKVTFPQGGGIPGWVWGVVAGAGVVAATALGTAVWAIRRLALQRAGVSATAGVEAGEAEGVVRKGRMPRTWKTPRLWRMPCTWKALRLSRIRRFWRPRRPRGGQ